MFWTSPQFFSSLSLLLRHGTLAADSGGEAGGPLWLLPHIEIVPTVLFTVGPFGVTNTLISSWISIIIVLALFIGATRKMKIVPKGLQNFVEWATELFMGFCEQVAGKEWGRRLFPFVGTIFFFVLFANWQEIIPGIDTIGTPMPGTHPVFGIFLVGNDSNKLIPWFRPAATDLNFTLALALISVVVTQIYGFRTLGFRLHVGKYITAREFPMGLIVGLFELITELARLISFSFRLFGNLFAGDVLLLVLGTLVPFLGPVAFYPLELFVGFIQAFVFAALTLIFISLAVTPHEGHAKEAHH